MVIWVKHFLPEIMIEISSKGLISVIDKVVLLKIGWSTNKTP